MVGKPLRPKLEVPRVLGEQHGRAAPRASPKVRIVKVKEFAARNLPEASALRRLLLEERDEIDREEFLAKMDLWLKLLRVESS
jgi:hypothetical protein